MSFHRALPFVLLLAAAGPPPKALPTRVIEEVTIAPLFHKPFACMEHPEGQLPYVGDALGTDCFVFGARSIGPNTGFFDSHVGDGMHNEDWYGWHAEMFAPFDGVVESITINPVTNTPGTMGKPPASEIAFRRADGVVVVYGHIGAFKVRTGDAVVAGQLVGLDGNNGSARAPHVHVGAYRSLTPLQIRWDLRAEGRIPELSGN